MDKAFKILLTTAIGFSIIFGVFGSIALASYLISEHRTFTEILIVSSVAVVLSYLVGNIVIGKRLSKGG